MLRDTTPEASRERIAALRRMTGEARLEQALELSEFVRCLAEAGAADRRRESEAA